NYLYSIFYGKKAGRNPWHSNTLEWTTPSEHIHGNWPEEIPTVYRWPYDYSKPGHHEDYISQVIPFSQTRESNLPHDFEDDPDGQRRQQEWELEVHAKPGKHLH